MEEPLLSGADGLGGRISESSQRKLHHRPANRMADAAQSSFTWTFNNETHTYTANAQGFRSTTDFHAGDPRLKLAFVGDSFTFGAGVSDDEPFPARLGADSRDRAAWNSECPALGSIKRG